MSGTSLSYQGETRLLLTYWLIRWEYLWGTLLRTGCSQSLI